MNPRKAPPSPFDLIPVETPTGCLVHVARAAVLPLRAAAEPPSPSPSSTPADVFEGPSNRTAPSSAAYYGGGASSAALTARRRRAQGDPTEQPCPAVTDVIGRFRMIINIVESTGGASTRPRSEVGELLRAVQRLELATGELDLRHRQQKRRRRPPGTSGAASAPVTLLQETIAAIERMHLSEPVEDSVEYAEVLDKLRALLRSEEVGGGDG